MKNAKGKGTSKTSREALKPVDDRLVPVSLHFGELIEAF